MPEWTADELASWIEMNDASIEPAIVHIRASQCATSSFAALRALTKTSLGDETGALASSLVTGIGAVAETNPAFGGHEMAIEIAGDPSLLRMFEDDIDDERLFERLNAATGDAARRLRERVDRFITRFGHRGFREAELRSPVWRERPAAVLAHVRRQLEAVGLEPDVIAARQQTISRDARDAALARLPALKRGWFNTLLTSARTHIAAREEMKDLLLRFLDLTRRVVAEAKVRLEGVLATPDDIYFLLDREVALALRGELPRAVVADIVIKRRCEFDRCSAVDVPRVQDGAACWIARQAGIDRFEAGDLPGLPVSPGIAEGFARVVLDPDHAVLEPGEILVAPVTDVAWTPLFLHAAGLVVEVGGPLSHGSIVAREYGLPAITAVAGATTRIRTGDRVRVDANRGIVAIVSRR
jgi:pyruvate,water dikinase